MLAVLRHSFTPRILATWMVEFLLFNAMSSLLGWPRTAAAQDLGSTATLTTLCGTFFLFFDNAVLQFSLWSFGLYSRPTVYSRGRVLAPLTSAVLFSALILLPAYWVFARLESTPLSIRPTQVLLVLCSFTLLMAAWRSLLSRVLDRTPYLGNVLLLGTGPSTEEAIRETRRQHQESFRLTGILSESNNEVGTRIGDCPVLGTLGEIREYVVDREISTILIALKPVVASLPTEYLLRCKRVGIEVIDIGEFYESIARKVLLEHFSPVDFLYRRNLLTTRLGHFGKVFIEKSLTLLLLVLFSPIMLVTALLVKTTSPGGILYRQTRTGRDGNPFTVLKFRSMRDDAEKDSGPVWAREKDPRVTPVGRAIRKLRIDEMPQIFNILRGDMSIVGPRPERPEFVRELSDRIPAYEQRHLVEPGLTGWAQVAFRYGASAEDSEQKLRYDLYYIKHMSLAFDLLIVITTIRIMLFGGGAR